MHILMVPMLVLCHPTVSYQLTNIIDLTWDFSNETLYWTGITPFSYTKVVGSVGPKGYWYAMNEFCAGEHGGTHFDAPYHFNKEGWKVTDIPIKRLIARGVFVDLSQNVTEALLPHHLEEWVRVNGKLKSNTVLLVKFGRSHLWPNRTSYMSLDAQGNPHFPGISSEAATWIARSRKIVGVGLDTPSVDPGSSTDFKAHRILSQERIYALENVKLVEELPVRGFTVLALPMKLKDGTGGPVRVMALSRNSLDLSDIR